MRDENQLVDVKDCLTFTQNKESVHVAVKALQDHKDTRIKKDGAGISSIEVIINGYSQLAIMRSRLNQAIKFTTIAMEHGEDEVECMYTIQELSTIIQKIETFHEQDILDELLVLN